jgi:cation transport regulator
MPYTINSIPDRIRDLPVKARKIWINAFNSAYDQYNKNEQKSNSIAWAAVKKAGYRKDDDGIWKRWK